MPWINLTNRVGYIEFKDSDDEPWDESFAQVHRMRYVVKYPSRDSEILTIISPQGILIEDSFLQLLKSRGLDSFRQTPIEVEAEEQYYMLKSLRSEYTDLENQSYHFALIGTDPSLAWYWDQKRRYNRIRVSDEVLELLMVFCPEIVTLEEGRE
jgi:hypothetical protein